MLNKNGNVFTLLGIQEDTEERGQQREHYNYTEEIGLLERKRGGIVPRCQHTEDRSVIEGLQNI